MKKLLFACLVAAFSTSLIGCSVLDRITGRKSPLEEFRTKVEMVLSDSAFTATKTGIKIVSLDKGDVLYERDAKMLLRPASNMKLLTTATALATLGKAFTLPTTMFADTLVRDSVLHGNLYFKGSGDPDLMSSHLTEMVSALKANGISGISGNIVGDATYFDDERWGAGWMWDDEPAGFAAYNSALTINRNCVEVTVNPGNAPGDSAQVTIAPATGYISVVNDARTSVDSIPTTIEVSRKYKEHLNTITVHGTIPRGSQTRHDLISVLRPEIYFLTLVREELARQNIRFSGTIALDTIPFGVRLLARHVQPIDSMIVFLNKVSDNLSAENTLKIIGAMTYGTPGSTEHGISVVKRVLANFGIDSTKFLMVDGSGVSHYNLLTPEIYVELLRGMYSRKDIFDLYYMTLPNAGVDGSLDTRMQNSPAQNDLHAKTGTISGVSTLSGYVHTADGEFLAFSMMMQNYIGSSEPYRRAQDAIGIPMANFRRK